MLHTILQKGYAIHETPLLRSWTRWCVPVATNSFTRVAETGPILLENVFWKKKIDYDQSLLKCNSFRIFIPLLNESVVWCHSESSLNYYKCFKIIHCQNPLEFNYYKCPQVNLLIITSFKIIKKVVAYTMHGEDEKLVRDWGIILLD